MSDGRKRLKAQGEVKIEIAPEVLALFEALPRAGGGRPWRVWTAEQDYLILTYWPTRRQAEVAKTLGICENTCRKRYRELKRKETENTNG